MGIKKLNDMYKKSFQHSLLLFLDSIAPILCFVHMTILIMHLYGKDIYVYILRLVVQKRLFSLMTTVEDLGCYIITEYLESIPSMVRVCVKI